MFSKITQEYIFVREPTVDKEEDNGPHEVMKACFDPVKKRTLTSLWPSILSSRILDELTISHRKRGRQV